LDIVKFDSHLLKMVAKHVSKALGLYLLKMEQLSSLSGSSIQLANVNVVNCLWHLKESLYSLSIDYYGSFIFDTLMDQTEVRKFSVIVVCCGDFEERHGATLHIDLRRFGSVDF
jgi:hypothetical protein